ncbi:AlbA family DNA-binding domain-containing protein [Mycolicibacterium grossiae]|uniref:AlbA family DNA-binding domain-containing protein n=1 Tax=Mycolicibacterium grossiae TaxID=1552759 RepID=UPI001FE512C6|nr:ATP-binding protein [Mycolicibacterium grossiae]
MNAIPARTEEELQRLALNGLLEETHWLDLKRELGSGNAANKDLAKDIAAFALDGGTILIGVDEGHHSARSVARSCRRTRRTHRADCTNEG